MSEYRFFSWITAIDCAVANADVLGKARVVLDKADPLGSRWVLTFAGRDQ